MTFLITVRPLKCLTLWSRDPLEEVKVASQYIFFIVNKLNVEICVLLGHYAEYSGRSLPTFRYIQSKVPSSRIKNPRILQIKLFRISLWAG